jgi:small subunit ribosomal protein S17
MSESAGVSADVRSVADDATAANKPQSAHVKPEGQKPDSKERGERKVREGLVVSDKMDKTVVVELEDRVKHPLYGKVMRRTNKVKAHDEENTAGVGDRVRLMETRPLSATKRWRLTEIIEKAK